MDSPCCTCSCKADDGLALLLLGAVYLVRTGQVVGTPRTVSLRLIDWYRANVSAGRQRCPTGRAGTRASCSRYGRRVVERYGVLLGWWLALTRMRQCAQLARLDYGPQGCAGPKDGGKGLGGCCC